MAGLSCGAACAKYILFIFNFVFFIVGAAIFAVGIYVKVDPDTNDLLDVLSLNGDDSMLQAAAVLFIVVGIFVFIVGFFGCCGACRENPCMLFTYAFLVGFVLLLQVVAAILAAVFKGKLGDQMRENMYNQVQDDITGDPEDLATKSWESMQRQFECCGSNGPWDYVGSQFRQNNPVRHIPESCCILKDKKADEWEAVDYEACKLETKNNVTSNGEYLHTKGCYYELKDFLESKAIILIGIGIGLAVVEIVGIILACCLRTEVQSKEAA